ncbi:MAG: hypothetical protein ABW003_11290 [Microvirga sp.]
MTPFAHTLMRTEAAGEPNRFADPGQLYEADSIREACVSLYFIRMAERIEVTEEEGVELPDLEAFDDLLRRTLNAI